jgi:hypothetical protein
MTLLRYCGHTRRLKLADERLSGTIAELTAGFLDALGSKMVAGPENLE